MDYVMKISMLIDTEAKKNAIRDNLKTQLQSAFAATTIKNWTMDIQAVIVPSEDTEEFSQGLTP